MLKMFEAIEWYMSKDVDLALRFAKELTKTLHYIEIYPELFQNKYRNVKIIYTKIFPYGIHYIIEDTDIFVLAVLHTSREPRK